MAIAGAVYRHTNVVSRDWRKLARFYEDVFDCTPVPPTRDHHGEWLDKLTGLDDARIEGIHLRVPGHGENGPTLEIFTYTRSPAPGTLPSAINQPGFAHICFSVDDVAAALNEVRAAGGGQIGDVVSVEIPNTGTVTLVYATDPEGNIVELQHWTK